MSPIAVTLGDVEVHGEQPDLASIVTALGVRQLQRAQVLRDRPDVCPDCAGTGDHQQIYLAADGHNVDITRCDFCGGTGRAAGVPS